jgi:hypothetical protein
VRAEEKALISLFEEGGRGEPRPPDLPGKRKPLNRGLTLLSFQGDEALVSFPRPPRLGEALLLREGPRKLLLQVVWAKAEERGWVARAKVRGPWDGILPGWDAEIFPDKPTHPRNPGPKDFPWPDFGRRRILPGRKGVRESERDRGGKGFGEVAPREGHPPWAYPGGAPCLVLDVNREYGGLPGVRTYSVGKDFKLGVREIGVEALSVMLEAFGTPATSLLYFETRLSRLFQEKKEFIGIDELISMAEEGEFYPTQSGYAADAVNRTLRSRLEALKLTGMVARSPLEASSFAGVWKEIREGGAVAFDLSGLSTPARMGFAQALLRFLFALVEEEEKVPFVFFEEAHLYVTPQGIDALVTRARHTGITSFFITNTPTALPEGVLRAADNLFVFRLPLEEDIKWVAKSGMIEESSLLALVQALPKYACLALGEATEAYPVVLLPDPLLGVDTRGKTRYFFALPAKEIQSS